MSVRALAHQLDYSDIKGDMYIYESYNPKKIYKFVEWDYSLVRNTSDDFDVLCNIRVKCIDENGEEVLLDSRGKKIFNDLVEDHRKKYENHLQKMNSFKY